MIIGLFKKRDSLIKFFFLFFLLKFSPIITAQISTNNSLTPNQLVQTVLLGGGLTATNVTFNGDPTALGSFNGSSSNIGFSGGLIMATGDILNCIGPNNTSSKTTNFGNSSSDPDLTTIASGSLNDAAILEFDFVPGSDTIKFRYVFSSEEYMEYAGSSFNDVFGFFISGPNPAGGNFVNKNIALIPGTTTPVSINNVNLNSNDFFYFDNGDGTGSGTAPDGQTVQYDGFTIPLIAISPVVCGQTYHIKLAITDVGDGAWDSGVFLEAGSFSSGVTNNVALIANNFGGITTGNDSTIYEGCGFESIVITRPPADLGTAQTFTYTLTGTATEGADYAPAGNSVSFAVNQASATITINSLSDQLVEGTETVQLELYITSSCGGNDTIIETIYIQDTPKLKVRLNDDTALVCPAPNMYITAQVDGGVATGGHTFQWQNFPGSTHDTLHVHPTTTTTYIVTVTDTCGNVAKDTAVISLSSYTPMQMTMSNDTSICYGEVIFINSTVSDGLPPYNYEWSPNITTGTSATVTPAVTTDYILSITDACAVTITDTTNVNVYPISAGYSTKAISNQTIQFNNLSYGGISFYWNFGDGSDDSVSTESNPEHSFPAAEGTPSYYTVTLIAVNQNDCADTAVLAVEIVPDFFFYWPNSFTPDENDRNDVFSGYGSGIKTYRMRVFNRWGQLLFESNDIQKGWDGKYKGELLESEVYNCVFDVSDFKDKYIRRFTNVNLIR